MHRWHLADLQMCGWCAPATIALFLFRFRRVQLIILDVINVICLKGGLVITLGSCGCPVPTTLNSSQIDQKKKDKKKRQFDVTLTREGISHVQ
jgi:hypothetical protein